MKQSQGLREVVEGAFLLAAFTPNSPILSEKRIEMMERLANMPMSAQKRQWRVVKIQARKIDTEFTKIMFIRRGATVRYRRKHVLV